VTYHDNSIHTPTASTQSLPTSIHLHDGLNSGARTLSNCTTDSSSYIMTADDIIREGAFSDVVINMLLSYRDEAKNIAKASNEGRGIEFARTLTSSSSQLEHLQRILNTQSKYHKERIELWTKEDTTLKCTIEQLDPDLQIAMNE
jgi:hypothetical protein